MTLRPSLAVHFTLRIIGVGGQGQAAEKRLFVTPILAVQRAGRGAMR